MQPRSPQRLIRVDVADAAHRRLIQEHPFDARLLAGQSAAEPRHVESGIERVAGDVCDLGGYLGGVAAASAGCTVARGPEPGDRARAERAWIGEAEGEHAVPGVSEARRAGEEGVRTCGTGW